MHTKNSIFETLSIMMAVLTLAAGVAYANLMQNDTSFEADYGPWTRQGEIVPCKDAPDGTHALQVSSSIMTYDRYNLKHSTPYVYSVFLKALAPRAKVMVQAYRTNWDGRFYQVEVDVPQRWTRYHVAIPPQKENDHNQFWMRVVPYGDKAVLMDAAQLEEGTEATPYQASEQIAFFTHINAPCKGNDFLHGEPKSLTSLFYNTRNKPTIFDSRIRVTDYYGTVILQGHRKMEAQAHEAIKLKFSLEQARKLGFYLVEYSVTVDGKCKSKTATFCVLPPPKTVAPGNRKLFGICGGSGEFADDMARMGVQATAGAFRWAYCQKDGTLSKDFLKMADYNVDELNKRGIDCALYFRRTPPWAAMKLHPHDIYPPKPEFIPEYEKFAFTVARHFKGRVSTYQLWGGEMDGLCDKVSNDLGMTRADFLNTCIELHKAGYRGIKRADPQAIVQTGAVCGVDCSHAAYPFQSQIVKGAKGYFDEVVVHPYCYPQTFGKGKYVESPEEAGLVEKYNVIAKLSGTPVTNGEYGYVNALKEPYDSEGNRQLAAYLARSFILTASVPEVRTLLWFTFANSEGYSLWQWPNPRPAVSAFATVSRLLTNAVEPVEIPMGNLVKATAFQTESGSVAAVWIPANTPVQWDTRNIADVHFLDLMGNELTSDILTLSGAPIFTVSTKNKSALIKSISQGRLLLEPVSLELRLESLTSIAVTVTNMTARQLSCEIACDVPTVNGQCSLVGTIDKLAPNAVEKLLIDSQLPIDWRQLCGAKIGVTADTPAGTVTTSVPIELMPCFSVPGKIEIDGNLSDWDGLPMLELKTSEKLYPPDAASHGNWKGPDDLSVQAGMAWNKDYFYFAAVVRDDVHVGAANSRQLCGGDCVQLAFDTRNDAFRPGYMEDDREFNVACASDATTVLKSRTWPRPPQLDAPFPAVAKRGQGCTIYEVAIPRDALDSLNLKHGRVFGFNFVAVDNDYDHNDYWMGITYGICAGKNPSVFKKFVLIDSQLAE